VTILQDLEARRLAGRKSFAVLLDPEDLAPAIMPRLLDDLAAVPPDYLLLGGSLVGRKDIDALVLQLKEHLGIPVVLFPGQVSQLSAAADAVLFLSLISGRNPELLIGQHVQAAPLLQHMQLEVIPTGYLLIDTGRPTAASYISHTQPIPGHKPELAAYTALAGQYLGLRTMYLDAGSGAIGAISTDVVKAVRATVQVPIIVGGGIRTPEQAEKLLAAGADLFVVGTAYEEHMAGSNGTATGSTRALLAAFAALTQPKAVPTNN
jgi:phosphoglycerol geranylgeranyltransferase